MQDLIIIGFADHTMYKYEENTHSVWEIAYYVEGNGFVKIGDEELQFEPGDIICQPPNVPHYEHSENGYRTITFCVGVFDNFGLRIPRFKDTNNRDFYNILVQLHREYCLKRKNWIKITESLLYALYQYMISWSLETRKNPLVENFESLLVSNISNKDFNLTEAMEQIPLNSDYFRRLFKEETGKSPIAYLIDLRINHAKHLLEAVQVNYRSIEEIGRLAGFDDPCYFSRQFKKVTSLSPKEWSMKKK